MKSLLAPPNAALVYLYRNESMGAAVKMAVLMDGANSGETVSKTYMVWQVVPGRHALVSKAENDSQIDLLAEPGRKYYVWQEVKMGILYARSKLQLVSAAQGAQGVNECKLVRMPGAPAVAPPRIYSPGSTPGQGSSSGPGQASPPTHGAIEVPVT